jgi:hypothetical protein
MNASVRRYKVSDAAAIAKAAEEDFVPLVREVDGFGGYYIVDGGDGTMYTITVAQSQEAVEESAQKAADWIGGNDEVAALIDGAPDVTNGEVLVSASS